MVLDPIVSGQVFFPDSVCMYTRTLYSRAIIEKKKKLLLQERRINILFIHGELHTVIDEKNPQKRPSTKACSAPAPSPCADPPMTSCAPAAGRTNWDLPQAGQDD